MSNQNTPVSKDEKLWAEDLINGGTLFSIIRNERHIPQEEIAKFCSVAGPSITRFEKGQQPERLECYIKALSSGEFPLPLTDAEAKILKELYTASLPENRQQAQLALSKVLFTDLLELPELKDLNAALKATNKPAFIMDSSLSVHAMNAAVLRLFNIDPKRDRDHLKRWEFWNFLSCKFYPESPFYAAHDDPNGYLPQSAVNMLQSEITRPYWFTWQMRALVGRLCAMFSQDQISFARAWHQAISFGNPYKLKVIKRSLKYVFSNGQTKVIYAEAGSPSVEITKESVGKDISGFKDIEFVPKMNVRYVLGIWEPQGAEAEAAFADIQLSTKREVFYANSYDTKTPSLHVNTWPEVEKMLSEK